MDGLTVRYRSLDEGLLDMAQLLDLALQRGNARRALGKGYGVTGHALDLGHDGAPPRANYRDRGHAYRSPGYANVGRRNSFVIRGAST